MKINTMRRCMSCILPFKSLGVIRIVHSNGRLQEIHGTSIQASDLMDSHPNHVLKTPLLTPTPDGVRRKIVTVPPEAELLRGKIYFLMPAKSRSMRKKQNAILGNSNDRYLKEILSGKVPGPRDGRRGCDSARNPGLESIWEIRREHEASSRTPEKPRSPIAQSAPSVNPSVEPELANVAEEDEDEDLDSLFKSAQDLLKAATSGTSGSGLGSTSQSQFSPEEVSEAKTALRMALLQNFKAVAHPARASNIKKAMDVLVKSQALGAEETILHRFQKEFPDMQS
ncbi:hypothetical protein RHSIM_Rhsim10G0159400 [Rhododendron simsii]|uniref:Uncharacterized protein n=1 Tax=Rhododendron simsii TaxID=118357 RepID=A0A834LDX5_RHOSS|nr:hypothetical protein RHSIM_Rhsim10G0159400 [Rhododendron simsii]